MDVLMTTRAIAIACLLAACLTAGIALALYLWGR